MIFSIAYAPDGATIATASDDQTARIWDAATGQLLVTLFPSRNGWMCWDHVSGGYRADAAGLETFHLIDPDQPQRQWHPADLRAVFDLDLSKEG